MSSSARIAIMLPRFSRYGGVEQFGYRLADVLAGKGHQVDFICARQEIDAPGGITVRRTGRPFGPRWLKMLLFCVRAEALCQAGEYDCAISLGKTLNQDIMRVGGGPLAQFWRYSEEAFPPGFPRTFKRLRRHIRPDNLLTLWIERRQFARTPVIAAVSHFVRDLILASYPNLAPEDIRVIYNRPDLARFSPPNAEQREEARRMFGIGSEETAIGLATSNLLLKGTGPLIQALAKLPETCSLYIAGGRNHGAYDALARRLGIGGRVRFLGKVEDMPRWYHALDVFTLPSFYDACSNAVLEALASGLPVLSSCSNGSSHFLPPENIVAHPGDSEELARVLTRLIKQAGENRKKGSRPVFTWPDDVTAGLDAFVDLVEDFLRNHRHAAEKNPRA